MVEQTKTEELIVCGKQIVAVRKMTTQELEAEGWEDSPGGTAIVLDDGTLIYASRDDEGNGPGTLFGKKGDTSFYIMATKNKPVAEGKMQIDKSKPVFIKDEGDFASVRQEGRGEIGYLSPTTGAIEKFTAYLKANGIKFESEYE